MSTAKIKPFIRRISETVQNRS